MSNAPGTPQDDTTRLEQTVQNEPTQQLDTHDPTRAIELDREVADEQAGPVRTGEERVGDDWTGEKRVGDDGVGDRVADGERVGEERVGEERAGFVQAAEDRGGDASPSAREAPERPTGPHGPAIVLGLVCLAVAGIVLAEELGTLSVDWGDVGPLGIVGAGAVLVLFGLLGLFSSRRGNRDRAA